MSAKALLFPNEGIPMPRSNMTVQEVAESLHVSLREVERMAEGKILPAQRVKGAWQFRAGEVWNWISTNMNVLPSRRDKDRHPKASGGPLLVSTLKPEGVELDLPAKTKASLLRELARLAGRVSPSIDPAALAEALVQREAQGSTALEHGVAVPHPLRPLYSDGPVLVAARTIRPIVFGERNGGLTDLFFMVCCPNHVDHLLYLGRLCRLLVEEHVRLTLRSAPDAHAFVEIVHIAEARLCDPT
jgi:excisionase family DNA binding protein